MKEPFPGAKTYLAAAIVALVGFAQAVGWLTVEQAQAALALAGAFGLVAVRVAISKVQGKQEVIHDAVLLKDEPPYQPPAAVSATLKPPKSL